MILAQGGHNDPEHYPWQNIERLIREYESASFSPLSSLEKRALAPYTAAVPIYQTANGGLSYNPTEQLREKRNFLRLIEWILSHPEALMG
jgi:hypothetical protein